MGSDTENTNSQLQSKKKSKSKKRKVAEPEPVQAEPQAEHEPVQVRVQVVRENPHKAPPFVGYFPSGFDPRNYSGSTGFQVYRNRNMTKRLQLVVKPAGASVEFVGTNYSGEATAGNRAMYALGVLDKDAKTLKIVPIAGNKVNCEEEKNCLFFLLMGCCADLLVMCRYLDWSLRLKGWNLLIGRQLSRLWKSGLSRRRHNRLLHCGEQRSPLRRYI